MYMSHFIPHNHLTSQLAAPPYHAGLDPFVPVLVSSLQAKAKLLVRHKGRSLLQGNATMHSSNCSGLTSVLANTIVTGRRWGHARQSTA